MPLHAQASQIRAKLEREGIKYLYHFTSIENLRSVIERGILSPDEIERQGIQDKVKKVSNDLSQNLDGIKGTTGKTKLNFIDKTPMFYIKERNHHFVYFEVNINIALQEDCEFSNINSTDSNAIRGTGIEFLEGQICWEDIRDRFAFTRGKTALKNKQAEILVDSVPMSEVHAIIFRTNSSYREGERVLSNLSHPPLIVDSSKFDLYNAPHVIEHRICSDSVTRKIKDILKKDYQVEFFLPDLQDLFLFVKQWVTPSTSFNIQLRNEISTLSLREGVSDNATAEDQGRYFRIPQEQLSWGENCITYSLNNQYQFSIDFYLKRCD